MGLPRTNAGIAEVFWWPGWDHEVDQLIFQREQCSKSDRTQKTFKPEIHPVELPKVPWEKVAIDIKGLLSDTKPRFFDSNRRLLHQMTGSIRNKQDQRFPDRECPEENVLYVRLSQDHCIR